MRFELLGPLRVVAGDGSEVTPRGDQQRRALTALAAAAPQPVSVDALEELLWPDGAPSANALQALVSKLRKAIAPATVTGNGRGYSLDGDWSTDVQEFERLVAAGRHADAEALVRGRPLAELADDSYGAAESARLAARCRTVLAERLTAAVEGDGAAGAVAELESLVTAEPVDERWWGLLMLAYYRSAQQAEALRAYQRARTVLAAELGVEPGPELRAVEQRILAHDPSLSAAQPSPGRRRPTVPARLATFVGRQRELSELDAAFDAHRLVTVTGAGGAGKTTTALEYARRCGDAGGATVSLVELAPVGDEEAIVRALARGIGLPDVDQATFVPGSPSGAPLDRVVDALAATDALVVLDNCEHVIAPVAAMVHRILSECPDVRMVATSREPLGVPGELVYALPPMPQSDAVELFLQRAVEHGVPGLTADDRVVSLCDRLDGLPLAIELAAARLRSMTLDELTEHIDDRFTLLSNGARTLQPRQQTLRSVVDWSHDLLDAEERAVFRRMAAFVGGATREAVAAVAADGRGGTLATPAEVLDVVARLVDKSLVIADHHPSGVRYHMLQTLHAYAEGKLAESMEREHVLVRHARYFADVLAPMQRGLLGPEQSTWFELLARERENVDAALAVAVGRGDAELALELVVPLGWYYFMAGELEEGSAAMSSALAVPGPTSPHLRAAALAYYGWLETNGKNIEHAWAVSSEAYGMVDQVDDPWTRTMVTAIHVMAAFFAGRTELAASLAETLPELAALTADPWADAVTRLVRGEVAQFVGDPRDAEILFSTAAEEFRRVGDLFAYSLCIAEGAEVAETLGDYERAAALLGEGIELARSVGFSDQPIAMRTRLGNVETLRGDLDAAERCHRAVLDDPGSAAIPWIHGMAACGMAMVERRRGRLDEARRYLDHAWSLPRSRGVPYMRALVLVARGYHADQCGEADEALELQREALDITIQLRAPRSVAYAMEGVAGALAASSQPDRHRLAAQLLGHADTLRAQTGGRMPAGERFDVDRAESRLRAALGDEAFEALFAQGAAADPAMLPAAVARLD